MKRLSYAAKLARMSRVCITCGRSRPPHRYANASATTCNYCHITPKLVLRAQLVSARRAATCAAPYQVDCAKCHQPRPYSYYPWVKGKAERGPICNSCLRRRKGRKGGRKALCPTPYIPSVIELRSNAITAREIERDQARRIERERVLVHGKRCNDCLRVQPASAYRAQLARRDGLSASCKGCEAAYATLRASGAGSQWLAVRAALRSGTVIACTDEK